MPRALIGLTACCALFLGFLGGVTTWFFVPAVANYFDLAFSGARMMVGNEYAYEPDEQKLFMGIRNWNPDDWLNPPAPQQESGLVTYEAGRVQPGYTLYTPVFPWLRPRLIDMQGNTIWEWWTPDVNAWGDREDGEEFPRDINPAVTDLHLYSDGRLLMVLANDLGYSPYGYAVVMLDKNSTEVWRYTYPAHHQLDVAADGRIAVMLTQKVTERWPAYQKAELPFLDEWVVILSAAGEELQRISVLRAFIGTAWRSALQFADPEAYEGDLLHLNSAKFLSAEQASHLPGAREGDLLLSFRNLDVIAVLNPETRKIVWATKGPWFMQHDPHVLPGGNLLLFDNRGDLGRGGTSRVIEVDPDTMEITWEWPGEHDFDLFTSVAGSVERLANGNTLIAETNRGRLIEVTREGDIVWEYLIPERITSLENYPTTKVWHPQRISPSDLTFIQ
jgi:hypothetical protein